MDRPTPQLEMPIPKELIDAIAERVADIILDRVADGHGPLDRLARFPRGSEPGTWMRSAEAAQYLGWSRKSVYRRVARMEMPHYKVDRTLLFKRDELDAWLEKYREEPKAQEALHVSSGARRRPPRARAVARQSTDAEGPQIAQLKCGRFDSDGVGMKRLVRTTKRRNDVWTLEPGSYEVKQN